MYKKEKLLNDWVLYKTVYFDVMEKISPICRMHNHFENSIHEKIFLLRQKCFGSLQFLGNILHYNFSKMFCAIVTKNISDTN